MRVVVFLIVTMASFCTAITPAVFESYCNYACGEESNSSLPSCSPSLETNGAVMDCSYTACGGAQDNFPFRSKPWVQGAFPYLVVEEGRVIPVNGGVPQRANITYHVEQLELQLESHIPNVNFTGNGVLDFEMWTPIWDHNVAGTPSDWHWHWQGYQNFSLNLTRLQHPSWSEEEVMNHTKHEFEAAGIDFFTVTLQKLNELRPNMKWGFYGFPQMVWGDCAGPKKCGYDSPVVGPQLSAENDRLGKIWANSGALFPGIYVIKKSPHWSNATYEEILSGSISAIVRESARLLSIFQTLDTTRPVLPYYMPFFNGGGASSLVPESILRIFLDSIWYPPYCTGIVIWDWQTFQYPDLKTAINNITLPLISKAAQTAQHCSTEVCHGNGWCEDLQPANYSNRKCICMKGFEASTNCSLP